MSSNLAFRPSRRVLTRAAVVAAVLPVVALSACSRAGTNTASASAAPSELTFGTQAGPPSLNPAVGDPAYGATYQWAYDPLVVMQPDGTFAPGLAVKFGYVAGSSNKVYEMTLRKGVKFSDGETLDAKAVKTYLDYLRAQKTGSLAPLLANVTTIDATGPMTVRITLKSSDPSLTFNFAQAFGLGNIASPKAVANPSTLDKSTAGAGPYMLDAAQTVSGDHYTFVPNPNYWNKDRQHWKKVTLRVIANPSSMIQSMRSGQVQAALGDPTTLSAAKSAGLNVIAPPQAMSGLNLLDRSGTISKPVGDVRVRQALNYAVDRKAIAKALYGDEALALSQYSLTGQAAYDTALNERYPYDVAKAKQLLAEAGYPNGITLESIDTTVAGLNKLMQAISGQLSAAGVTLKITTKPGVNDYVIGMLSTKYPTAVMGYGLANMASLYAGFINPAGPFNPFHYKDAELDKLYAQYYAADEEQGAALQQQINARLVEQAWSVPVVGAPLSYYTTKGITGLDATSGNSGVPWLTEIRPAG